MFAAIEIEALAERASSQYAGLQYVPYSGRLMFGKRCPAIASDDAPLRTMGKIVEQCDDVSQAAWLLKNAVTDDFGRGTVIYWPAIPV